METKHSNTQYLNIHCVSTSNISLQYSPTQEFRDKNRGSKQFNHLSAVSEAVPAFGWVCVAPRPLDYMGEMIGAADFYLNRVLKDFKEV